MGAEGCRRDCVGVTANAALAGSYKGIRAEIVNYSILHRLHW
jgi:hypothetical protein